MYKLDPEPGMSYLYKLEGNSVSINQVYAGSIVFLRVESPDVTDEQIERLQKSISQVTGSKHVIILPPGISVLRVSPVTQITSMGATRECMKCGGTMRSINNGGMLCYQCGNEIAPPLSGGQNINEGSLS